MSNRSTWTADGRVLLAGRARGVALVLDEPLSFWGGVDQASGAIIDLRHPQHGHQLAGRALVMPAGRGSSSSSSVLAEAIRSGHGPALICLGQADEIVALGVLVAHMLYAATVPVLVLEVPDYERIRSGDSISVEPGGRVVVGR